MVKDDEEKTPERRSADENGGSNQYQRILSLTPQVPEELKIAAANIDEPLRLAYFIGTMLKLTLEERQELLELDNVEDKLRRLSFFLGRELEILELSGKIHSEVQEEISKLQKEHYLREQLSAIKKELGEESEVLAEITKLRGKMEGKEYPRARRGGDREGDFAILHADARFGRVLASSGPISTGSSSCHGWSPPKCGTNIDERAGYWTRTIMTSRT